MAREQCRHFTWIVLQETYKEKGENSCVQQAQTPEMCKQKNCDSLTIKMHNAAIEWINCWYCRAVTWRGNQCWKCDEWND